jgi:hypothetical protein
LRPIGKANLTPSVLSNPVAGRVPARDFDEGVVGAADEVIGDTERVIVNERRPRAADKDGVWRQRI